MTLFSWAHTTPPRTPLQSLPSGLREAHDGYDHLLVDASGVLLTGPGGAAPPLLLFSRRPHNASLIGNFWEFAVADHPGAASVNNTTSGTRTRNTSRVWNRTRSLRDVGILGSWQQLPGARLYIKFWVQASYRSVYGIPRDAPGGMRTRVSPHALPRFTHPSPHAPYTPSMPPRYRASRPARKSSNYNFRRAGP